MADTEQIGLRVPSDLRKALAEEAKKDSRSLSGLVLKILVDWMKGRTKE